jgi:hypothetical protein
MPIVKPMVATSISKTGLTPKSAAATTNAGLPKGTIVPAAIVARKIPARPKFKKKDSMSENSGIPATLNAFRSQIKINDAITAMKASIIDERIHDALSKLLGDSLASWLLFVIATTLVNIKKA